MSLLIKKILEKIKKIDNVKADKINITSGVEYETGQIIDGKKEYGKRINCGRGPNNGTRSVATGLFNVTYLKIEGTITNGTIYFPLNNTRPVDRY